MTTVQALTTEAGETIKFRQFEIVDTGHIDTRRYKGVTEGGEPVELNCYCDSKGWEEYWKVGNRRFVEYSYDGGYFEGKPLPKKVVREYGIAILDVGTNVIADKKHGTITNIKGIRVLMYQVKFVNDKTDWFYEDEVKAVQA